MFLYVTYFALAVAAVSAALGFAVLQGRRRGLAKAAFWTALATAGVCAFFWFFTQPPPT